MRQARAEAGLSLITESASDLTSRAATPMRALCVSIHDVAPATLDACRRIANAVQRVGATLPLTLLVVPHYHGDDGDVPCEYSDWISSRLARGDELALHGYTHMDDARAPRTLTDRVRRGMYTAGEGEFSALSRDEAAERIARGRRWFAQQGWPLHGFVAPAWLVSRGTWEALDSFDFMYTTTLGRFHVFKERCSLRAPTVVYSTRSRWRRWTSRGWNAALVGASRKMPLVRVGFHPADAAHPQIMSHALSLLEQLADEREPLTKAAFARTITSRLN